MADERTMTDTDARRPYTREVATAEKDIDIFSGWTGRLENPDVVLRLESGGQGVKIYEELERDWQVFSMLQTRALALQACEWQVEPASDRRAEQKIADFVFSVLKEANFDKASVDLSQALLTGYKPLEIMWDVSEGDVFISEFRGRRPSRFVFDLDYKLRLLTFQNMTDGEPVPSRKFVTWSSGGHDHNPYGQGLGYNLYWPVWFKKNGIRFWMVFAEKFGSPTVVGKYPPGTSPEDKATLLDAIKAIQQQTGIRIPETMALELLEAKRTGIDTYEQLCEYFDRGIAKVVLGQTLTTEPGKSGSLALGKVHDLVRRDILKADADSMCETINRTVVRWIVDYNFPAPGRDAYPKVWRRTEPEKDLKALADRDKVLIVDMGMGKRIPETYISDTYNIPLAEEGEATIDAPQPAVNPALAMRGGAGKAGEGDPEKASAFAETDLALGGKVSFFGQEDIDRIGDVAPIDAAPTVEKMLGPVLALVGNAASLEEIGERIYQLYPGLSGREFQELLARAMFAAELMGYGAAEGEERRS
jgi:phage gp29-like protein